MTQAKKLEVIGVIPARGGSRGIPHKNIEILSGKPLIAYTIEAALACPLITDVVVSTDDKEIREIALKYGAQAPFLRPSELATDLALAIPTIQHAVREMEKRTGKHYDIVVMLQPTTPLRSADDVTDALSNLVSSKADGIISVVDVDNWHPMKMKKFTDGLLKDYEKPPMENPPRQILPKVYMVNGAIYAAKRDVLMERDTFQGDRCLGHIMPPERSVNVDTLLDFKTAEWIMQNR